MQQGNCNVIAGFVWSDLLTCLERTSDHCSNIALAVIEVDSDSFDTHEYVMSLREMKDEAFSRYYEEYKKNFAL